MWMQKQSKYENTAYVALWGLLFAAPLLSLYVRTASDSELSFNWQEVFIVCWFFWSTISYWLPYSSIATSAGSMGCSRSV